LRGRTGAHPFIFDLNILKRALIAGETSSGRGHMGMPHRIDDHFMIRIPGIKVINPVSKTNWEGTGVEPDIKVKAEDALETAEKLAESRLRKKQQTWAACRNPEPICGEGIGRGRKWQVREDS